MIHAAIDIGTVTCRLLVAEVNGRIERELVRECRITDLGIGVSESRLLREDAIERVVACIADYRDLIDAIAREYHQDIPTTAIATSAARDARNSQQLVDRLAALGVDLSIIPGTREADLSFRGASAEFPDERIAVLDVGGGSTEVIFGSAHTGITFAHSFDIGCRRITEAFIRTDPPAPEEMSAAREYLRASFASKLAAPLEANPIQRVIAVAGTATSVVSVDEAMAVYDPTRVHKTVVPAATLARVLERLAMLPEADRRQVIGLEPKRAGVIVAGMLILQCALEALGQDAFTVSESDILQGIIMSSAEN